MVAKETRRNPLILLKGFGVAALAVAISSILTLLIPSLGEGGMYFLFLTAVIFSTLQGDIRAGAFAAFASLIANFFLLSSMNKTPKNVGDWVVLLAFGMAAGFTIFLFYIKTRLETARIDAERRYRIIFEDAITGIYETTIEGRYTTANPKLASILGYDSSEDLINGVEDLDAGFYVEPERRKTFVSQMEEHGSVSGFESEVLRFDGVKIWISENAVAVRSNAGSLIGFQGTTIEITDRKRAEAELLKSREELETKVIERTAELELANRILRDEMTARQRIENALRDSEEKFRTLVETSTDLIWEVDEKGFYTYLSPKIKDISGREPEEVVGKRPYDLMTPEEAIRVKEKVREVTSEGKGYMLFESVVLHKDGSLITTETSSVPIYDIDGNLRGGRGVARDITERKRTENALRQSEEKFRTLVETSSDLIWETDSKGFYTYVSPRITEILGLNPDEVVGKRPYDLMTADESIRVKEIVRKASLEKKGLSLCRNEQVHKDGRLITTETSSVPFYDNDGNFLGARGVGRDVTDQKRIEKELRESQTQLRELTAHLQSVREDERKYIARELHDEIGQKLTAVKIDLTRMSAKLIKGQGLGTNNISPILNLVDDAMDTTRKIVAELRPGVLDELGLAAALQWQVQEFKKRSAVTCELEIHFDEARMPKGAKITLFRILQECLTNITRHAEATRVRIMLKDDAENLLLIVEDDGTGIRLEDEKKPDSFGIVGMRERALLLGGDMMITRRASSGTRISVIIPIQELRNEQVNQNPGRR